MAAKSKAKRYPDLRHKFIRGLIAYERWQRSKHYLKSAAEWTSRAIVSLSLSEKPVKSVKQANQLEGIGGETVRKLKEIHGSKTCCQDPPPEGKFVSSAAALLVALLIGKEQLIMESDSEIEHVFVPAKRVHEIAKPLCQEAFADLPPSGEPSEPGFCPAWWRMHILIARGYVKKRSFQKRPVYELLPMGQEIAYRLRASSSGKEAKQLTNCGTHDQTLNGGVQEEVALYTNDEGKDGVVLHVDTQEWGGDRAGLGQLVGMLNNARVRYRTRRLPLGDYVWIYRKQGQEVTLPLMAERKRADDLAHSMRDGRYARQKAQMTEWKQFASVDGEDAGLLYLVEGDPAGYVVRCVDGCGGVGRCGNPTLHQVQEAIQDLSTSPDFNLLQTESIENTVEILASITEELCQRVTHGEFDALLRKEGQATVAAAPGGRKKIAKTGKPRKKKGDEAGSEAKTETTGKRKGKVTQNQHMKPLEGQTECMADSNNENVNINLMEASPPNAFIPQATRDSDSLLSKDIEESLLEKAIEDSILSKAVEESRFKESKCKGQACTSASTHKIAGGTLKEFISEETHVDQSKTNYNWALMDEEYIPVRKKNKVTPLFKKHGLNGDILDTSATTSCTDAFSPPYTSGNFEEKQKSLNLKNGSQEHNKPSTVTEEPSRTSFSFLSLKSKLIADVYQTKAMSPRQQIEEHQISDTPHFLPCGRMNVKHKSPKIKSNSQNCGRVQASTTTPEHGKTDFSFLSLKYKDSHQLQTCGKFNERQKAVQLKNNSQDSQSIQPFASPEEGSKTETTHKDWDEEDSWADSDNSLPDLFDDGSDTVVSVDRESKSSYNNPRSSNHQSGQSNLGQMEQSILGKADDLPITTTDVTSSKEMLTDKASCSIELETATTSKDHDVQEECVAMVAAILPDIPRALIKSKLLQCDHDVEQAVGELLDQAT